MSGGHFNYKQFEIGHIADDLARVVFDAGPAPDNRDWDDRTYYEIEDTQALWRKREVAILLLQAAQEAAQRWDWFLSGDDGEDNFHARWEKGVTPLVTRIAKEVAQDET